MPLFFFSLSSFNKECLHLRTFSWDGKVLPAALKRKRKDIPYVDIWICFVQLLEAETGAKRFEHQIKQLKISRVDGCTDKRRYKGEFENVMRLLFGCYFVCLRERGALPKYC